MKATKTERRILAGENAKKLIWKPLEVELARRKAKQESRSGSHPCAGDCGQRACSEAVAPAESIAA